VRPAAVANPGNETEGRQEMADKRYTVTATVDVAASSDREPWEDARRMVADALRPHVHELHDWDNRFVIATGVNIDVQPDTEPREWGEAGPMPQPFTVIGVYLDSSEDELHGPQRFAGEYEALSAEDAERRAVEENATLCVAGVVRGSVEPADVAYA
jgi:hypothetical protein